MTVKQLKQLLDDLKPESDNLRILIANECIQEVSDVSIGVYDTASQGEVWDFPENDSFKEIKQIQTSIDALIISVEHM